jgi:hypothetical protein
MPDFDTIAGALINGAWRIELRLAGRSAVVFGENGQPFADVLAEAVETLAMNPRREAVV